MAKHIDKHICTVGIYSKITNLYEITNIHVINMHSVTTKLLDTVDTVNMHVKKKHNLYFFLNWQIPSTSKYHTWYLRYNTAIIKLLILISIIK